MSSRFAAGRRRPDWTDPLTGAWNRRWLRARPRLRTPRDDQRLLAVMLFDADSLGRVNDREGFGAGDVCLVAVYRALVRALGPVTPIVRIGGDEFLASTRVPTRADAVRTARAALREISTDRELRRRRLGVSAGIALTRGGMCRDWLTLTDAAYRALSRAKRAGGRRVRTTWV
ncbi:MAG: GGDEF domain-containing protein [Kiritimatiellae bacterium]|nr:GGDEF domain-containing protein [Kiritimatiellia bacterium]